MLRRNPRAFPFRLGKRAIWSVAVMALSLLAVGIGNRPSAADSPKVGDSHGDPLPAGALARLGTMRLRHGGDVTFVAFGADGKTLITASRDNTIRVWDLAQRKEVRRFTRPQPDAPKPAKKGEKKPGANEDAGNALMQMMAGAGNDGSGFRVAVTADGKTLAAATGNVLQLWDIATGKSLRRIPVSAGGLAGLLFSPDGKLLAGRAGSGTLFLWATDTGKEVQQIKPPKRPASNNLVLILGGGPNDSPGMAFTPDSKTLVAAGIDYNKEETLHSVKMWDVASGKEVRKIKAPDGATVSVMAVTPDGKLLAYGTGNIIHLCEAATGKEVRPLKTDSGILALAFTPDGKSLIVRGRNQRIRLWETATGKEQRQLADAEPPRQTGGGLVFLAGGGGGFASPEARVVAVSPDGKQIAAAAGSTVRLWDTATGKELPLIDGHWRAPLAIVLSPDGKTAVSWGADRVVRRWETATGKPLGAFPAPPRTTLAAFSADGRTVALANADNTLRLHDTATGKELHRIKAQPGGVAALAFAPDGKVLAARGSGNDLIHLYDVAKGAELRQVRIRRPNNNGGGAMILVFGGGGGGTPGTGPGLAFSPDGKLIVTPLSANGGDRSNKLVFFDAATGKELRRIESPQPIASFAFSPDGRTVATENADRTLTLWEVASAQQRARLGKPANQGPQQGGGRMGLTFTVDGLTTGNFTGPGGPVGLAFSPDGRALAVRGPDLSVRVWDVTGGKEIGQLKGHSGRIETVAFAANGKALASGATDTTVLLWDTAGPMQGLSKPQPTELATTDLEALWADLAGQDAARALRGLLRLAAAPRQATPFLAERLKPATRVDPKKLDGWIADLESEKFAVRQAATTNLLKIGEQALPALQKVLASSPPLETRKRVEELVDRLTGGTLTAEQLRLVRAVEALERMATPEARKVLRTLADGAPGALPTREAQAALERLK